MDLQVLLAPVVGGVIGYTTNWLAIKMLFKPHKAYHIGKVKVPFTPGLIPRERDRIAKSLGTAVGDNLLTEEVILRELTGDKVIDNLKDFVMNDLLAGEFCIHDMAVKMDLDEDEIYDSLAKTVQKVAIRSLKDNPMVSGAISSAIASKVSQDMTFSELIGSHNVERIHRVIDENDMAIADGICLFLSEEEMAGKATEIIGKLVSEKMGGLAAMFVDPSSLYENIVEFVRSYLEEEENRAKVCDQIKKVSDKLLNKRIGDVASTKEYVDMVDSVSHMIEKQVVGFIESDGMLNMIKVMLADFGASSFSVPERVKEIVERNVESLYRNFAESRIPVFLEQMNLSNVVETQINNFSTQQVEDLIFGIVDRELKAITWLGALLGFVMGTVTIFL